MSGNQLSGSLPTVEWPSALSSLSFHSNKLSGQIPPKWISGAGALRRLYLYENYLTGSLPSSPEIWLPDGLTDLKLGTPCKLITARRLLFVTTGSMYS